MTNIHALALASNGDVLAATDQGYQYLHRIRNKKVKTIGPKMVCPIIILHPFHRRAMINFGLEPRKRVLPHNHYTQNITVPAAAKTWDAGQIECRIAR